MPKFSKNSVITPIEPGRGFDKATVIDIFTEKKGRFKGRQMYLLKIINGTATMPVETEECYKLLNSK